MPRFSYGQRVTHVDDPSRVLVIRTVSPTGNLAFHGRRGFFGQQNYRPYEEVISSSVDSNEELLRNISVPFGQLTTTQQMLLIQAFCEDKQLEYKNAVQNTWRDKRLYSEGSRVSFSKNVVYRLRPKTERELRIDAIQAQMDELQEELQALRDEE